MSVIGNPLLLTPEGYQISRSVRLRSSASASFSRSRAATTNNRIWTFSGWVKRGALGVAQNIISGIGTASTVSWLRFETTNTITFIEFDSASFQANLQTAAVFRDPSAWYHIEAAYDSTQATATDRFKLYVNGVQQTMTGTSVSSNWQSYMNFGAGSLYIGREARSAIDFFDGYLTEVNFIDGQALTPSSFGETDAVTGVWKPKKYAGTYGTNGFYLNFSDPSAATAAAIGKDYSGNGNNWTPNNISVTAGATYDSMLDVPTPYADGGNGRGNYATWNPLTGGSPTSGNLVTTGNTQSTIGLSSGAYYWEVEVASSNGYTGVGFTNGPYSQYLRWNVAYGSWTNGSAGTLNIGNQTAQTNCTVMCAMDVDNNKFWMGVNGTWFSSGDPASGSNPALTLATSTTGFWFPEVSFYAGGTGTANFGQRPFAYTPPTGFKALNTQNLPEPTIKKGNQYFDATTYTGNGSTQSIVNSGGMQPDLVWAKNRATTTWNSLQDVIRGATKELYSNATDAEATYTNTLTSFNSNGFSVGNATAWNGSGNGIVAWQWKANGAGVSNTDGSITSTVSAGVTQGFSVVTYTGTGAVATVGHGLGVAPKMIIVKSRSSAGRNWIVYHESLGATKGIQLNLTGAAPTVTGFWNNTAPTSSVFTVGGSPSSGYDDVNLSAATYVAYCFAEVPGFSKFGSYTGNGSTDGAFVFCGFRPRWLLVKRSDAAGNDWFVVDTARDTYNLTGGLLRLNTSAAETTFGVVDTLSNGFKVRTTDNAYNANGGTYIYAAFAEHPFKNALAR